jgi:hypothetical protein
MAKDLNSKNNPIENFMKGGKKAPEFDRVTQNLIRESNENLIDPVEQKRAEDWSALSNKIVGAEIL